MKIRVCLSIGILALGLTGCATKEYDIETLKSFKPTQIMHFGTEALQKRDYKNAVKYFEAVDALYPFDREAKEGQLKIIYAYYKLGDNASTLSASDRYIHLYPEDQDTDYAYYMKGVVNFQKNRSVLQKLLARRLENLDISNLRDAFFNFSELLHKFPRSKYAVDTEKRMLYIRDLIANHELNVAKFYFSLESYIACINRATNLVTNFSGATQVPEAMRLLIKSYRALGMKKEAEQARQVFKLNFPTAQLY